MENPEELKLLKIKADDIRRQAFNSIKNSLRLSLDELKHTGYKTKEQAAIGAFEFAYKKIQKITKEYLEKYPDE